MDKQAYLLLDSHCVPLAHGLATPCANAETWRLHILKGNRQSLALQSFVQLIDEKTYTPVLLGRVLSCTNEEVLLEPLRPLTKDVRENLRIPASFSSYIYPLTGLWKGRYAVQSNNLSCSGVSFRCRANLAIGEHVELVLPITAQPLIVCCEILRCCPLGDGLFLCPAKFVSLLEEETTLILEAVFDLQVQYLKQYHADAIERPAK